MDIPRAGVHPGSSQGSRKKLPQKGQPCARLRKQLVSDLGRSLGRGAGAHPKGSLQAGGACGGLVEGNCTVRQNGGQMPGLLVPIRCPPGMNPLGLQSRGAQTTA